MRWRRISKRSLKHTRQKPHTPDRKRLALKQLFQSNLKIVANISLALIVLVGFVEASAQSNGYSRKPVIDVTDSLPLTERSELKKLGSHKQIPAGYEKQILYTLSFFPELAKAKIKFRISRKTRSIIATRPTWGALFRKANRRTYVVVMSDSLSGIQRPAFTKGPVNGQVGILGHEFSHIVYFNQRSGLVLIGLGLAHLSKKYIDRFEYSTDQATINRGLAFQLIDWKLYLRKEFERRNGSFTEATTPRKFRGRYMSVEAIRKEIANNSLYKSE